MPVAATEMLSVPWGFRALNRIGAGLNRLGLAGVDLSPSRLILQAEQATGLRDFGPEDGWREGLERLVRAYEAEGGLSFVGRHGLHAELQRALQQRLLLLEQHRLHPEIGRITMDKPVFILGFPRTGTTVLHNLVALAPGLRAPRMWELLRPCPPPDPATEGTDPRVAALKAELAQVHRATPDLLRIHPLDPTGPDECFYLFAFSLHQRVADAQAPCPSFMRWVMEEDMRGAYQVHRKALQVLAWRYPPRRWSWPGPTW